MSRSGEIMPRRDRSLLGVGDLRSPEAPPAASRIAQHAARDRDDEARLFRTQYVGLRRLAAVASPLHADPDEIVTEAIARCLVRRPLSRWDDLEVERAVLAVAGETDGPSSPFHRDITTEQRIAVLLVDHEHRNRRDAAAVLECSRFATTGLVAFGRRRVTASGTDLAARAERGRPRGADAVVAAAHDRVAAGRPAAAPIRVPGQPPVAVALVLLAVLVAGCAWVATIGIDASPNIGSRTLTAGTARTLVDDATPRPPLPPTPYDPLHGWQPYQLSFSKVAGIEVPVGAFLDGRRDHIRQALLGEVYTIAATPDGPPIGYHHQLFGYLPADIVEQPGFEWATWVAEHWACAPSCLALPTAT